MLRILTAGRTRALAIVTGLLAAPLLRAAESGPRKIVSLEGITEYRLDNGLQVLLFPDASRSTVTVNLTVLVGSRHEGYGEAGMAHLLEHLLFKGTPDHPSIPKALQERGARFNGSTWLDRTNYFETLPASDDNLEFGVRLEADRLVNSFVKKSDLDSEMSVVRNEFEMGENCAERNPEPTHAGGRLRVAQLRQGDDRQPQRHRAGPDRQTAGLLPPLLPAGQRGRDRGGQVRGARALALIQQHFGRLPRPARELDRTYTEEPPQDGERLVTLRRVGDVSVVGLMYHTPSGAHPDNAALEILSRILATPPSGRLYQALVETKKASHVAADAAHWHDPGVLEIVAEVRKENSLEAARDILIDVTEKVAAAGVTEAEVERARQQFLKQRELAAADSTRIAVQLSEWAAQGDWRLYLLARDRIEKVTAKDVQAVAQKYLQRNNRTVGLFIPTDKAERVPVPPSPNLAELFQGYQGRGVLSAGEVFDPSPKNIEARSQRTTLPDGLRLVLLPKKTRGETVHLRLTLRYGNVENLKGFDTAADVLPQLLTRGTTTQTRQQIQDELDRHRATLSAAGDTGFVTFTVQTKRTNLPAVLALVREILRSRRCPR